MIAAVDGVAVGMGAEFTSQCDIRIASSRARFAWNFAHRGLVPDTGAGTWLLPRLIGPSRAMKLLFTGAFLPAAEALSIGYVDKVVEPDALLGEAMVLAREIAKVSPFSNVRTKALLYEGFGRDVAEHMKAHRARSGRVFCVERPSRRSRVVPRAPRSAIHGILIDPYRMCRISGARPPTRTRRRGA